MTIKKPLVCVLLASSAIAGTSCRTANDASRLVADDGGVNYADETPQIMTAAQIQHYKDALPQFAYPRITQIVNDSRTFWYDEKSMIASYQDSVHIDIIGCRKNSSGASLIDAIPGGRTIFNADGSDFAFPFGHTAGTDKSTNIEVANFLSLPVVNGRQLPIAYYVKDGNLNNLVVRQWRWVFPKGTILGELLYIKDKQGKIYLSELRTRERHLTGWSTNSFRPFATAEQLGAAIKERRPNWQSNESLRSVIDSLDNKSSLKAKTLTNPKFATVFSQSGALDELPDFRDDELVKELLTKNPFISVYGTAWKNDGSQETYAATTKAAFSIVPNNNEIGMIPVTDDSCQRCHKDAQRPIRDFAPQAILYGDIWGSDQIFSFHPFDQQICTGAGADQRRLRPTFKGKENFIQVYNPSIHPKEHYTEISKH